MSWNKVYLAEIADIILGGTPKTKVSEYWGGEIPWISVADFSELKYVSNTEKSITQKGLNESNTKLLRKGSIVISARGTVGKLVRLKREMAFNQSCYAFKIKDDEVYYDDFLYYVLMYLYTYLIKVSHGAVFNTIIKDTLNKLELPSPNISTQRKIASILSAYDELIENNSRRIKILEGMAQAIYKEWFVNFRFPGYEKVKFVDLPAGHAGSPLGKIPEEWEVKKLGDILELKYGKGLRKDRRVDGPYPVFGSGGIVGSHHEYLVKGPCAIVGRKGNVGSVFLSLDNFFPIDTVYYTDSLFSPFYLYYVLKNQTFINTDAAVPGLNRETAQSKHIIFPLPKLIDEFSKYTLDIYNNIELLKKKNTTLRKTRDLLLPKLMSGEVEA